MKTLTVALLFVLSLVSLFASARADALAWSHRIEPRLAEPQSLLPEDGKKGGDEDKKKGGKGGDKKGGDDTERDEEDYRALSQRAALQLVDPGVLDDMLRLRAAVLSSR